MLTLGIDIGSSSIKLSVFDTESGKSICSTQQPPTEMSVSTPQPGWAEQDPEMWWNHIVSGMAALQSKSEISLKDIEAIGVAYQMHGLVIVDENQNVVRPSIIWCDSRAVSIGEKALAELGGSITQGRLLNSPANFTASKLRWVQENEPSKYAQTHKMMLPGDFIIMRLSGEITTTSTGLSEGILWDYEKAQLSQDVLNYYGISQDLIPDIKPIFGEQVRLQPSAATLLGLQAGVPVTYRAGDQLNNAFSLNVLDPGAMAATAGTSAVIYGVTDKNAFDKKSRVNTFQHVNSTVASPRNGVLLCVNGSGILYQWLRNLLSTGHKSLDYEFMNGLAASVKPGSEGLKIYPFGNGAERILENKRVNGSINNLDFNTHSAAHIVRGAKEGIVFALKYGFEIMRGMGIEGTVVRAGKANLFLSEVFRDVFVNTVDTRLELYDTNGAEGAARGAAIGAGGYSTEKEAFESLVCLQELEPDRQKAEQYNDLYNEWKENLK